MSAEPRFVDVTYRGLKVASRAKLTETAPGVAFVEVEAPLPVGTMLKLSGDLTLEVRVAGVVEQEAGAKSPPGMRIAWGVAPPAVVVVEAPAGDSSPPEPSEPGSSGSLPADETAAGNGDGKRRRRKKGPGRPAT